MAQNINPSFVHFSIFVLIILLMISKSTSSRRYLAQYCSNDTMFANNSQYQANLNTLFHYLSSNATNNPNGYHQELVFSDANTMSDTIYGHFLCRGDQSTSSCHDYVTTATTTDLPKTYYPNRKDAIIWYNECLVRYSNNSFFGRMDEFPAMMYWNANSIYNNETRFMELMKNMMNIVIAVRAASGGSRKKSATDYVNNTAIQTIYKLGQCTPDLTPNDCNTCLVDADENLVRCVVRYEVYPFFDLSSLPPPTPPPPPSQPPSPTADSSSSSEHGSNKVALAIRITIPKVALIALAAVGLTFLCCKRRRTHKKTENESEESISLVSLLFRFDTVRVATDNFSDANKLGRGGFGTVYKGTLANGQKIAVKRLAMDSGQGDGEFKTEVLLVAKLQHRNLIKLLGFCLKEKERLLIYEFVANTSLDNFLFDVSKRTNLNWETCHKITVSIARGILYLHEDSRLRIIHRDLNASNVLLDADMNPKIADFGLARLFGVDQTQGDTDRIVGTYGYMAPEYAMQGFFSVKSDVFSFGILGGGTALDIVDPTLSTRSRIEIIRSIHMGLLCVQESMEDRPTMSSVLLMLSSQSLALPAPSPPAFFTQTASIGIPRNFNSMMSSPREY
ncbi:Cysteine-rich receptor-like protein kinase 25 [Bienertia sinuspersici]